MTTFGRVVSHLTAQDVSAHDRIEDLGLDSLDWLQLKLDLDTEFGVTLDVEKAALCTTVGELVALVDSECSVSS